MDQAITLRRILTRLAPDLKHKLVLSRTLAAVGRLDEVRVLTKQLLARDPAALRKKLEQLEREKALLQTKLDPKLHRQATEAVELASEAEHGGELARARELLRQSLALRRDTRTTLHLGRVLRAAGDLRGARQVESRELALREQALGGRAEPSFPRAVGHTDSVTSVDVSDDGALYASSSRDGLIKLWDARNGRLLESFDHERPVSSVVIGPQCRRIYSGGSKGLVRIWDARKGREPKILWGQHGEVRALAIDPKGLLLASGAGDKIRLGDSRTGHGLRTLRGHKGTISALAFSPNGGTLASASHDGTVKLWDPRTGLQRRTLKGHQRAVTAVAFSPGGELLASAGRDRAVILWDSKTGRALRTIAHDHGVDAITFEGKGGLLVSTSAGTVKLWNPQSGALQRTLSSFTRPIRSLAVGPRGKQLVLGSGQLVRVWDLRAGGQIRQHGGSVDWVHAMVIDRGGRLLASQDAYGIVKVWDLGAGRLLRTYEATDSVRALAMDPRGTLLAMVKDQGRTTVLLVPRTGRVRRTFPQKKELVSSVAIHPRGGIVAIGTRGGTIQLWGTRTGKLVRTIEGHTGAINTLAFSWRGGMLVSGGDDGIVNAWGWRTGKLYKRLRGPILRPRHGLPTRGPGPRINTVALDPRSRSLAAGSQDQVVRIYDLRSGELERQLKEPTGEVLSVAVDPERRLLVSGARERRPRLWDLRSGRQLRKLGHHSDSVHAVAFLPGTDGRLLVTGGEDGLKLQDAGTGRTLASFVATRRGAWVVTTPDGFVDASDEGRWLLCWRVQAQVHGRRPDTRPTCHGWNLGWVRGHVPGLLGRLVRGDTAFRLEHLRRLAER
jgi:WD40 repeat protein